MEDLNCYIKKIFFIKTISFFIMMGLLFGSIVIDYRLFYNYRYLENLYNNLSSSSNLDEVTESQTKEINEFYTKYTFLDKANFESIIECTSKLDCKQVIFTSENTKITFYTENLQMLNYYVDFFENNGFEINIVSVKKENENTYFEMEVN